MIIKVKIVFMLTVMIMIIEIIIITYVPSYVTYL